MPIYYQDDLIEIRVYSDEEQQEIVNLRKQESRQKSKQKYRDNIDAHRKYNNDYVARRRSEDPLFKLRHNLRNLIRNSMKGNSFSKTTKTAQILGCSMIEFKQHIEKQFTEGMCWQNYGEWEYDHVRPVSWAQTENEILELNHYLNFQPLWKTDNQSKSNKFAG